MIGVVIPAHDEEAALPACLAAAGEAARHPALAGEPVEIVVVLDACTDGSARVAGAHDVAFVIVNARNVGVARATGARTLLERGARWLAFTDADTRVAPDWLVAQLALGADAVCGTVAVDDWADWAIDAPHVPGRWARGYTDRDGHRHVHGANLGVSATAYRRAGGFMPLAVHEDVALVDALVATDARIAWSAAPRVRTSARRIARAAGGFADFLARLPAVDDLDDVSRGARPTP